MDVATIKYNSKGEQQWLSIYQVGGERDEKGLAIAGDKKGNVFVVGVSEEGESDEEYFIIKYNSKGEEEGVVNFKIEEKILYSPLLDIEINDSCDVYVGGITEENRYYLYFLSKYRQGKKEWEKKIYCQYNLVEESNGFSGFIKNTFMGMDKKDNFYLGGKTNGYGSGIDFLILKYDKEGKEKLLLRSDEGELYSNNDSPRAIAVDGEGNVYVIGKCYDNKGRLNYGTIKYNKKGEEEWIVNYDGPAQGDDEPVAIAIDRWQNIYVTGKSKGSEDEYATIKYNPDGVKEWIVKYRGERYNEPIGIKVDDSGNVYVTGNSNEGEESGGINYLTVKYNSKGEEEWIVKYDSDKKADEPSAIAIDDSGNVYVTGKSYKNGWDYVTVKYNSKGEEKWIVRYKGDGNGNDEPVAIVLDKNGNVYVTGKSDGGKSGMDYATVKYNSRGEEEWIERYNGSLNKDDCPVGIAIDKFSNVYVTGYSVEESGVVYTTIKYCDEYEVSIKRMDNENKNYKEGIKYTYNNNKGSIIFSFNLPSRMFTSIKIFDASGKEISRVVSKELDKGNYRYEWNGFVKAKGVYFYQLRVGRYNKSGKFVLY